MKEDKGKEKKSEGRSKKGAGPAHQSAHIPLPWYDLSIALQINHPGIQHWCAANPPLPLAHSLLSQCHSLIARSCSLDVMLAPATSPACSLPCLSSLLCALR
jgi:hypothetical protein